MNYKIPKISQKRLLKQALTHRSYANENPYEGENNERLEFLGDAVLGFLIGEFLYKRYPQMKESELSRLRSKLVDEKQLASIARKLQLGKLIHLGKGAEKDQTRESSAVLSDTFEALIGAYFLDAGIEAVKTYLESLFTPIASEIVATSEANQLLDSNQKLLDSKNLLQHWAIVNYEQNPIYELIIETGPAHAKSFTVQVKIEDRIYGVGKGKRKQEAEKQAALDALKNLGLN